MHVQEEGSPPLEDYGGNCGQPFLATSDLVGRLRVMTAGSVAALDPCAKGNSACFKWLDHHAPILERGGVPRAEIYPACARFKFGDVSLDEVRCAADIPAGPVGGRGESTAFALAADIPALSRKGA